MRPRHINQLEVRCGKGALSAPDGSVYTFDGTDLARIRMHHWYVGKGGRLCTHVGPKRSTVYLSRFLTSAQPGQRVEHIDGDVHNLCLNNLSVVEPKRLDAKKRRA